MGDIAIEISHSPLPATDIILTLICNKVVIHFTLQQYVQCCYSNIPAGAFVICATYSIIYTKIIRIKMVAKCDAASQTVYLLIFLVLQYKNSNFFIAKNSI